MFSIISWIISIALPYITGKYIDSLIDFQGSQTIFNFTMGIFSIGMLGIVSSFISNYSYVKLQTKSAIDLNLSVLNHVSKLPILYFKDIDTTYLNQRINSDSNTLVSFILNNILNIIIKALTLIFLFYVSFKINRKITIILMPLIPLYLVIIK